MKKALVGIGIAVVLIVTVAWAADFPTIHARNSITNDGTLLQTGAATINGNATFAAKATITGNLVLDTTAVTVATALSGTTLTLPALGTFFIADDTLSVTRILPGTGSAQGRVIYLFCPSAGHDTLTDGVNLVLAGNFNGTANDFIALVQRDTFFVELFRSQN